MALASPGHSSRCRPLCQLCQAHRAFMPLFPPISACQVLARKLLFLAS